MPRGRGGVQDDAGGIAELCGDVAAVDVEAEDFDGLGAIEAFDPERIEGDFVARSMSGEDGVEVVEPEAAGAFGDVEGDELRGRTG